MQMVGCLLVFAFGAQHTGEEIVATGQIGSDLQSALQKSTSSFDVALLHRDASQVYPAIGIGGVDPGDLLERLAGALQVALQEESNPIIVPPCPILRLQLNNRRRRRG